jgi:hypothetical protein
VPAPLVRGMADSTQPAITPCAAPARVNWDLRRGASPKLDEAYVRLSAVTHLVTPRWVFSGISRNRANKVQFRGEAFNFTDTPHFNNPGY